ncbi:hypermethylated in cancer 2 protein isoform X1 [Ictidomys tridecemlineatus]|uniref:Hypermethylated in cancer 2 protein n=1 Tax=Ictidomys tridecemlineatus TaxID=43179 RepID=A0A287D6G1_ICTTR|nr:hypermethylated in cancer 2 protein [Ictidomys tridecemlineatus]KAG3278739.1 HIC ZBTB transcriptional repressor 2 [Ictidomys tridecemlineatus]
MVSGPLALRWCAWAGRGDMGPDMELPSHSKQLLLQLNQQRTKGFLCDVIIMVENSIFRAHKNVLAASSIYFKSLVLHDNLINLDTDMVSSTVFQQILDFIYTGKLLPSDQPAEPNFSTLLTAASYLQLPELAALCRRKLKRAGKPFGSGRVGAAGMGRPSRSQRLSTASVIQARYPGLADGRKGTHAHQELPPAKGSDDELYLSGSTQESTHSLGRGVCPTSGEVGLGGCSSSTNGSTGGCEQELGLDLSKKSPPLPPTTPVPHLTPDDPAQLSDSQQDSPPSASALPIANSASYAELGGTPDESMDLEGAEDNHLSLLEGSGGQPRKSLRHSSRKKEWSKKDPVAGSPFERREAGPKGPCPGEESEGLGDRVPNGILSGSVGGGGPSGPYGDPPYPCKEEEENGKDGSEDSGQSGSEGGSGHPGAHYMYRQEGYETVSYGDNLYVCIPCAKGFPSSEQLNAHVETHTEEELFIKEEGAYETGSGGAEEEAEDLSAPSAAYAAEPRPFKCSVCEKTYKDPATLRQHEKTHWLTRPFPCNICGKMFTQRGTMTRHMRSHLGLKPFACDECGMRFTRQYRLTEHMRVHSGEKPYECQLCGGKFTQQRNLISHLRMHTSPS